MAPLKAQITDVAVTITATAVETAIEAAITITIAAVIVTAAILFIVTKAARQAETGAHIPVRGTPLTLRLIFLLFVFKYSIKTNIIICLRITVIYLILS